MRISHLAVKRPIAVLMLVGVILLLGVISFTNLPLDLLPDLQLPVAFITTDYRGAAPAEVESMVTNPLENALGLVQNLNTLSSTSSPGSSMILMQFNWGTDMDFALLEVRERLDMVRGFLPDGVSSPRVMKADPSLFPVVHLEVSGDETMEEINRLAENVIKPRLERQDGVAMVSISGGGTREVAITLDPFLLGHYGVSMDSVAQIVAYENINVAAGSLVEGGKNYQVRTIGEYRSLDEIENLVIPTQSGIFYLGDLAKVEERVDEPGISRFNGERSVSISVNKQSDANTVQVSRRVDTALEELKGALPASVKVHKVMDQAEYINESIFNVVEFAFIGGLLAVFVLYLFLRNLRSTLIITLAIPVSVVATFVLMYFTGLTANLVTLGGLALGLGIMVDNSIVVVENIFRLRTEGVSSQKAAPEGASQVSGAIVAATLTTVVVFLPVVFVEGIAAQIFTPLALMVSFSLLTSLVVALTVVPVLSDRLMGSTPLQAAVQKEPGVNNDKKQKKSLFNSMYAQVAAKYSQALVWSLKHRALVVIFLLASLGGSLLLIPSIGQEFLPYMDEGHISVRVNLPVGSSQEETARIADQVEARLMDIPEVGGVAYSVGSSGGMGLMSSRGGSSNRARLEVNLVSLSERSRSSAQVAETMREGLKDIPGAEIAVTDSGQMGGSFMGGDAPLSLAIRGDDLDVLKRISGEVADLVREIPGTREVETSFDEGRPEILVTVERDIAASYGFTGMQAANLLRTALSGQRVARMRTEGRERDILLVLPEEVADSREALEQLPLLSPMGSLVPLREIARFEEGTGPINISRYNQVRTASVSGQVVERDLGSVMDDIKDELKDYILPEGYHFDFEGEQRLMDEAFDGLYMALVLAVVLVYMIMAAQFESLLHPLIIMFSMPQAITGVILSLALTGRTLSVVSLIGTIMLAGIVVNNGIVLVDYVNLLRREEGLSCHQALLAAGPVRLRPILMTTLTTILGMFPLALGLGSGAEMQAPIATVVIGGLLFSSILTLVVIPVIYSLSEDATVWFTRRLQRSTISAGGESL